MPRSKSEMSFTPKGKQVVLPSAPETVPSKSSPVRLVKYSTYIRADHRRRVRLLAAYNEQYEYEIVGEAIANWLREHDHTGLTL